jgi:hypothetical protein
MATKKTEKKTENKTAKQRKVLTVGNTVVIRTVTFHYLGIIVEMGPNYLVLGSASWLASSGRWTAALKSGSVEEVEPFVDDVELQLTAIVDATRWRHALPTEAK